MVLMHRMNEAESTLQHAASMATGTKIEVDVYIMLAKLERCRGRLEEALEHATTATDLVVRGKLSNKVSTVLD